MNQELLHIIEQISREKGIEKAVLVEAILSAVLSAARKRFGSTENLKARLDDVTGAIALVSSKTVVRDEELTDENNDIGLEQAQAIDSGTTLGDTIEITYEIDDFGRIAAQTAKQVIIQKVREAERDMIYREFKDRQGDLVNGMVGRIEREGNLIVDLGKTEGLLPRREQSFRETFRRGDRIRAYILEVKRSSSGHQVILSRTHPGFLIRLFEMEVPEIYEGIVEIKEAVRDPSGRAKIAVMSNDKDVDPVGACVGMKGMRVQAVVQELRGEKIDIIQWTNDQEQFVRNALSPAKVTRVYIDNAERAMQVIVPDDQLSLAIGKRGQNVRLAAKLTHWKIDIKSESETDSDVGRQEALRRAEMAFHSPPRTSTDTTEAAGPNADVPSSETLPASGSSLVTDTKMGSTADPDETVVLLSPLGSEEDRISSELCGDTLAEDTDASTAQRTVISDDTKEKAC